MKTNFQAAVMLALLVCANIGLARAEEYNSYFNYTDPKPAPQATASPSDLLSTPAPSSSNSSSSSLGGSGCSCGTCDDCCGLFGECNDCSRRGIYVFSGFDSWRGVADGSFQNKDRPKNNFGF